MIDLEYTAEAKCLFQADHYGWSVSEAEITQQAWTDNVPVEELVSRLNTYWTRRKADRNA